MIPALGATVARALASKRAEAGALPTDTAAEESSSPWSRSLVTERVGDRDRAPHAVAEQVEGMVRMAGGGKRHEAVDVGDGVVHAVDEPPRSRGAAVAAVVECVGREAGGVEAGGDVPVAPGVLADAVG